MFFIRKIFQQDFFFGIEWGICLPFRKNILFIVGQDIQKENVQYYLQKARFYLLY